MTPTKRLLGAGRLLVVLAIVFIAVFPVYWIFTTSTLVRADRFQWPPVLLPDFSRLGRLGEVISQTPLLSWMQNSAIIAMGVTVLSLFMAILSAYALSRFRFRGKGVFGFALFATQMLPEALLIVPLYAVFLVAGLLNDLTSVVLASTAFIMPVATWIIKGAMDGIPLELEESARLDGVPRIGVLWTIVLPLVAPAVAASAVIAFFDGWNEYLFSTTFLSQRDKWPASVGLASYIGEFITPQDAVMAAAFIYTVPAVVFFLLVQRYIVSGLTTGAVKE